MKLLANPLTLITALFLLLAIFETPAVHSLQLLANRLSVCNRETCAVAHF